MCLPYNAFSAVLAGHPIVLVDRACQPPQKKKLNKKIKARAIDKGLKVAGIQLEQKFIELRISYSSCVDFILIYYSFSVLKFFT